MRIIFMGTPLFSVPTLEALVKQGHEVVAVYTQPPKPKGRGHHLQRTPVHACALALGLPVYTPLSLRDPTIQQEIKAFKADVGVVVAYGLILPRAVLEAMRWGCVNIHASLLPRWRGAAPIHRALMAGDSETGITIMKMDEGLDTGPMISQVAVSIHPFMDVNQLQETLSLLGAHLLIEVLESYPCPMQSQPDSGVTYASKISKQEAFVDWHLPAEVLVRHIRVLNPWPGAVLTYQGQDIKILEAKEEEGQSLPAGTVLDDRLLIQCGKGALRPLVLQRPGKSPVSLEAFLNGTRVPKGTLLLKSSHAPV